MFLGQSLILPWLHAYKDHAESRTAHMPSNISLINSVCNQRTALKILLMPLHHHIDRKQQPNSYNTPSMNRA